MSWIGWVAITAFAVLGFVDFCICCPDLMEEIFRRLREK